MKTITISKLIHHYQDVLKTVPKEGILVTKNSKPHVVIYRPDREIKKELGKEIQAKAEESVRRIKIDTFNEKEVDKLEHLMGMCSRCHTKGEVVRKQYVNEQGKYHGKWLCLARCYNRDQGVKEIPLVKKKEVVFSKNSDFGSSNEKSTF